ncbi:MAG: hypothetical protein HZB65_01920 [Candidatus Aenigmarchaeota archaeon]|nr:hypothetical protein [Candidatus Aenigmarchaeota archaeon]
MSEPIPMYGEQAYTILYNKFGTNPFSSGYFKWFLSESMRKKILHVLEKKGWIRRIEKGKYICIKPEQIIKDMIKFRVPGLLELSKRKHCYTKASAVEIWTDFSYIQRSWEHSPYFIRVLKSDIKFWVNYLKSHGISVFLNKAETALGEFVVLIPEDDFKYNIIENKPVDSIKRVAEFCNQNIDMFEYPLAYLIKKFQLKTDAKIDPRILKEL